MTWKYARRALRNISVILFALVIILGAFRLVGAGSLTPSATPAGTMNALSAVYAALVGTFDSSSVVASKQGDAMQVTKCIILKVTGGTPCP